MEAFEKHYRVNELAKIWGWSTHTITRLFSQEPGVIELNNLGTGKRKYSTMSIPASVASTVHQRLRHAHLKPVLPAPDPRPIKLLGHRRRGMTKQPADFFKIQAS